MRPTDARTLNTPRLEIENLKKSRSTVKITPNKIAFSQAMHRLKPYKALPEKTRPALESIADYVRSVMIPRTFRKEGPGWAPLSMRTQREREFLGYNARHPILKRTGDLMKELATKGHPKHIEVIKVGRKARVEIGGSSAKFVENQMGNRQTNLPARPMIPGTGNIRIDPRDRIEIKKILQRTLARELKTRK